MRQSYLSEGRVLARVRALIQGLTDHPELGKGLPTTPEMVKKALDEILEAGSAQEQLKKTLLLATRSQQIRLRNAREMVSASLAVAAMIHQPNSDAVVLLGGKPRRGGRRKAANQSLVAGAGPSTATNAA